MTASTGTNLANVSFINRTKIICTIGPSSGGLIPKLIGAGMDIARINFSHGTDAEHRQAFADVRKASESAERPIGIMADLSGPKVRLGELAGGSADLHTGSRFVISSDSSIGDSNSASTSHASLADDLRTGDRVLLADGAVDLRVLSSNGDVVTEVLQGGTVLSHAGVNVPSQRLTLPPITEEDRKDLEAATELGFDFIAQSFVRSADDVQELRTLLGDSSAQLIAKIETGAAVEDIDRILTAADGIMVARGDLGVELPFTEIPIIQKSLLIKALSLGTPSIVATQMLESMVSAPRPTRAEASDVANAVLDGADAIMLSAETAIGRFPLEAAAAAAQIAGNADRKGILPWGDRRGRIPESEAQAIAHAAGALASSGAVAAIVCFTQSGLTAQLLSAIRPNVPILALSPNPSVVRQLTLRKAVMPHKCDEVGDTDSMIAMLDDAIRKSGFLEQGSLVVMVGSTPVGGAARTNFMKVHRVA